MSRQEVPRRHAARMPADGQYTATQAAQVFGIKPHVITRWAKADKIAACGRIPAAVPGGFLDLYTLTELRPLVERYQTRGIKLPDRPRTQKV